MKTSKTGFFTNAYFIVEFEREKHTKGFFRDSKELAKFIDKILHNYDNHPCIYYTAIFYRQFRKFKRGNLSEHGRGANEFYNILEYEGGNCYIPSGNECFLKCIKFFSRKILASSISKPYNQIN